MKIGAIPTPGSELEVIVPELEVTVTDLEMSYESQLFMPPTMKKLEGHIASGAFVQSSVHS